MFDESRIPKFFQDGLYKAMIVFGKEPDIVENAMIFLVKLS